MLKSKFLFNIFVRSIKSGIHLNGQSNIETQKHILWCQVYADLRANNNINDDKDLIEYIKIVISIRDNLKIIK